MKNMEKSIKKASQRVPVYAERPEPSIGWKLAYEMIEAQKDPNYKPTTIQDIYDIYEKNTGKKYIPE